MYIIEDRTFMIVKGSSCLEVNLGLVMEHLRFLASSQAVKTGFTLEVTLRKSRVECDCVISTKSC